jgi:soluble lytic murein transglycosylase
MFGMGLLVTLLLLPCEPTLAQVTSQKTAQKTVLKSSPAPKAARKSLLTSIPDGGRAVPVEPPGSLVPVAAEEQAFFARMDAILAPLYDYKPSDADLAAVREAIQAVGALQATRAQEIEARIQDPVARKLVRWYFLRHDGSTASPAEIEDFRRANPDFPEQNALRQRAEEALLIRVGDPKEIKAHFEKTPPQTGAGFAALAAAHLGEGNRAKAQELTAKTWREHDLSLRAETILLNTLGGLLSEADHKARLDRLLMKDIRWPKERGDRASLVRRVLPYLSEPEQKKAQARLAVYLRQKDAAQAVTALPADAMTDWGVYFAVVQLNRRAGSDADDDDAAKAEGPAEDAGKLKEAWRLLLAAPADAAKLVSPDDWWVERRVSAYAALRTGQPKIAYDLVRQPGPLSVNALKDAHMLAGWIALRHLNDVKAAEGHFIAMRKAADGPISVAGAEYWLARTALALNDRPRADTHFRKAMPYFDTFYGQLARQALEPSNAHMRLSLPPEPSLEEQQRFMARDAARAVIVARRAGIESLVRPYLAHLRFHLLNAPGEIALVAHLSHSLGDTQWSLRTAKAGLVKGHNLVNYAFPTHAFPNYQPLREPVETAFLLGIARQESEFNTSTLSGAGARGVLQVMPMTARHICRDYRVRCDIARLSSDAAYNSMIASAYIGDRMTDYAGSYIMTLAGYNAGPGRVRQWVREFGDPRSPDVDPIDWIERIPFEETREYVKKVLANIQVYRARIGQPERALQLVADLNRARGPRPAPPAPIAPVPAAPSPKP